MADESPIAFSRTGNTGPLGKLDRERKTHLDEQTTATLTVPSKPGRDPALEKIEADALKAAPIPAEVREFASRLKAKTRTADTARAF